MPYSEQWGATIRDLLTQRGLSLRQAGLLLGMHPTQVGDMRKGWIPKAEKVRAIARALQIPENRLLTVAGYSTRKATTKERLAEDVKEISRKLDQIANSILALSD